MKEYILLFLFIFILLVISILLNTRNEDAEFVSRVYMNRCVNESEYFKIMNNLDLKVRHASSKNDYKTIYVDNLQDFTRDEKYILVTLIKNININLDQFNKIFSIPWKLTKTSTVIEMGFPHTIADVIVLSDTFFKLPSQQQLITLLHEKIHIFQRLYPLETHELITNIWKFEIKQKASKFDEIQRNNPDNNSLTYGMKDFYILQVYHDDNVTNIAQSRPVKVNQNTLETSPLDERDLELMFHIDIKQLEHPYEIMASYLPYILLHQMPYELIPWNILGWLNENCV